MIAPAITAPPTTPAATPGPHPPPLHPPCHPPPHPRPRHWAEASVAVAAKAAAIAVAASKQVSVFFIVVPPRRHQLRRCADMSSQPCNMISLNLSELSREPAAPSLGSHGYERGRGGRRPSRRRIAVAPRDRPATSTTVHLALGLSRQTRLNAGRFLLFDVCADCSPSRTTPGGQPMRTILIALVVVLLAFTGLTAEPQQAASTIRGRLVPRQFRRR
jgi:hypothetical protein